MKKLIVIIEKVLTEAVRILTGLWVISLGAGIMIANTAFFYKILKWAYQIYLGTSGIEHFLIQIFPAWFFLSVMIIGMIVVIRGKNILFNRPQKREEVQG